MCHVVVKWNIHMIVIALELKYGNNTDEKFSHNP